jgi:nitroreductase
MRDIAKSLLKVLYYSLKAKLGKILLPKQYKWEYVFFEQIRGQAYSDLLFQQAKLRAKAHQIDKVTVFDQIPEKTMLCDQVSSLIQAMSKSAEYDTSTIEWAKNVLSQYGCRLQGQPPSKAGFKQFDDKTREVLAELVQTRRSIRSFKKDPIDGEILYKILEAGLWGPTGCNRQTIEYLIIEGEDDKRFCQRMAGEGYPFPTEAPMTVIVLVDPRNYALPNQRHMAFLETGSAVQNMLLTAYSYGVGSCWLFWNDTMNHHETFVSRFKLMRWLLPTAMVCFGFPNNCPTVVPARKNLVKSIHWRRT